MDPALQRLARSPNVAPSSSSTPPIPELDGAGSSLQIMQQHEAADTLANPDAPLSMATYRFPHGKLKQRLTSRGKTPLVLVACGSFSPPTLLHLRLFILAGDHARTETNFEVIGGYMSPVSDAYRKVGLAPAPHRVNMCRLAVGGSKWVDVDPFEAIQSQYMFTAKVLDHFDHEINGVLGGVEDVDGNRVKVQIALLAGADLLQTMSQPGVWSPVDLQHILGNFGIFVIERAGTDLDTSLDALRTWQDNIHVIPNLVPNEISSTKVRLLVKRQLGIDYLTPDDVINYIVDHGLYQQDSNEQGVTAAADGKGKQKLGEGAVQ